MFDIGATELLVIIVVAVIAIGPKDLPLALRTAGRWIGKIRRVSGHFRSGLDTMIREAEMEDQEKEWRERNAKIMQAHPQEAAPAQLSDAARPVGEAAPAGSADTAVIDEGPRQQTEAAPPVSPTIDKKP